VINCATELAVPVDPHDALRPHDRSSLPDVEVRETPET
jgi:hypothetical protein